MRLHELDESLRTENPCWKGYHPVGTKKKNGRTVPNCVPNSNESTEGTVEEDFGIINLEFNDGTSKGIRASSNDPVRTVLNYLIRRREFDQLKKLKRVDGRDVTDIIKRLFRM